MPVTKWGKGTGKQSSNRTLISLCLPGYIVSGQHFYPTLLYSVWQEYQFQPLFLCFQWFLSDDRSLLLVNRSSSDLVERWRISTYQSSQKFIMIAFTIKTQKRINDASHEKGQWKWANLSTFLKLENSSYFPLFCHDIKELGIRGRVLFCLGDDLVSILISFLNLSFSLSLTFSCCWISPIFH